MFKQKFNVVALIALLLSACGVAAPAAQPAVDAVLAAITEVRAVELREAPAGTRIYNPEAISLILSSRSAGAPIPEAVYAEAVRVGLPVESIARINAVDFMLVQGSKTGLEPKATSGYIVGYNEPTNTFIKLANNLARRQNSLIIGRNGVNAMLSHLWGQYGDALPDGFPKQTSNLFWAQFPSGGKYLAYESGNFGFTLQHEILQGLLPRDQAALVWRDKFLREAEVCASTGLCAPDPNPRNGSVVRLRDGRLAGMSFDLEARGAQVTSVTPEVIEKLARMNKAHAEKLGVVLDTTIPESLRLKYPVLSQFMEARTGFTLFGVPVDGKNVNLYGYMPTGSLMKEDVQAVAGRVREMIKTGQLNLTAESVTIGEVTTNRGTVQNVTLIRADIAAENAFRSGLLKGLFWDTSAWVTAFTLVDWVDTQGLRGVEVYSVLSPYEADRMIITTGAGYNNLDDIVNNANTHRVRWQMHEIFTIGSLELVEDDALTYSMTYDPEFLQWLFWETGYPTIKEFRAAMETAGVPNEIWIAALSGMTANTTYPFQIYGFVANGRMPLDLRASSFVNDYGESVVVFWGASVFESGDSLSPIATYRRTPTGWVNDGFLNEPVYISLSEISGDWYQEAMCTVHPPANVYLFSCVDVTPR